MNEFEPFDHFHAKHCRAPGESFEDCVERLVDAGTDRREDRDPLRALLLDRALLPGSRIQRALGRPGRATALNCFVSGPVEDSIDSIMLRATEAAETIRCGGGIGYDFSRLRPRGARVVGLEAKASGPVSFMEIFDAVCRTVSSAGLGRGAQMAVLRCDHPDVREFVTTKSDLSRLNTFNLSVGVTNRFMRRAEAGGYSEESELFAQILGEAYEHGEPGLLFLDSINGRNPIGYAEKIEATNPCGEQPLPPFGSCCLAQLNLTRFLWPDRGGICAPRLADAVRVAVRFLDNVIDRAYYPLEAQRLEASRTRRIGLGITGLANAFEACGLEYGSHAFLVLLRRVMSIIRNEAYLVSSELAEEKGAFPAHVEDRDVLGRRRNSHLLSIAPCGTVSLAAGNVSPGIEPVFAYEQIRDGLQLQDYGVWKHARRGKRARDVAPSAHLAVAAVCQEHVDAGVSKTVNLAHETTFHQFRDVYQTAWRAGLKGVTVFRERGARIGAICSAEGSCE